MERYSPPNSHSNDLGAVAGGGVRTTSDLSKTDDASTLPKSGFVTVAWAKRRLRASQFDPLCLDCGRPLPEDRKDRAAGGSISLRRLARLRSFVRHRQACHRSVALVSPKTYASNRLRANGLRKHADAKKRRLVKTLCSTFFPLRPPARQNHRTDADEGGARPQWPHVGSGRSLNGSDNSRRDPYRRAHGCAFPLSPTNPRNE